MSEDLILYTMLNGIKKVSTVVHMYDSSVAVVKCCLFNCNLAYHF